MPAAPRAANDFLAWQRGLGATATPADGNHDGRVDQLDRAIVAANTGRIYGTDTRSYLK
jgi:hypothetical protein